MSNTLSNSDLFIETQEISTTSTASKLSALKSTGLTYCNHALAGVKNVFHCPLPDLKQDPYSPFIQATEDGADDFAAQNFSRLSEINVWEK